MNDYTPTTAFVFGGGGVRGAVEVGMLKALLERGVYPDLVVGTSVGAMNAAALAQNPTLEVIDTLIEAWSSPRQRRFTERASSVRRVAPYGLTPI